MKGYRWFVVVFVSALILYIVWEAKRPVPIDWSISLSKEDKNPYGSYILYHTIGELFPKATMNSYRQTIYDQLNNYEGANSVYFLIAPQLDLSAEDVDALLNYVVVGNYAFIASDNLSKPLMDSLKLTIKSNFEVFQKDSSSVNFVNPFLKAPKNYTFKKMSMDSYLASYDTTNSFIAATNDLNAPVFIKMPYGDGAFYINVNPLCFSNYFMLTKENARYTACALSYIPATVNKIYWDEYYKLGAEGTKSALRFIMKDVHLRWAYRLTLIALVMFVLFESKRRQRIIPIEDPLKNTSLEFVQTIGNAYFNKRDNKNIAEKKINYFFEFLRTKFYLHSVQMDDAFLKLLSKKAGMSKIEMTNLIESIKSIQHSDHVSDAALLQLNELIDDFYDRAK